MSQSKGKLFKDLVQSNSPLQVLGTINAYCAMLAESAGAKAIYLSGAGIANASFGLPDLGMTSLPEVVEDARRITGACDLPLMVDIDTGWGHAFNIARSIYQMESVGVAAVHIEDQVLAKRCGHRPNKAIVSQSEMADRIKAAVDARCDPDFVIMARTDAFASEGMSSAVERSLRCIQEGADMIFLEAVTRLEDYEHFCRKVSVPVLANITEFGKTPLFTVDELKHVGVKLVLYPLSAFRMMSKAALNAYQEILLSGTQSGLIDAMQTREELYETLKYIQYEKTLDNIREMHDDE